MPNDKVSLIIPFYNEERELYKVFQDIKKFEKRSKLIKEYLFFDDASSDKSFELCKKFQKKYKLKKKKFFLYKNNKNLGWAKTLMRGLKLSKGKFCLYIPGDGEARLCEFFLNKKINFNKDVIIFQRKTMHSRPFIRVLISKAYRLILYLIFPIKFIDLNGIILIKKNKIRKLNIFSKSFFISAEIIIKSYICKLRIDENHYFTLMGKDVYKSSSLNFFQLKLVTKDLLKLVRYVLKF